MRVIGVFFLVVGCGVKTAPRSTIIESIPAVPFKETIKMGKPQKPKSKVKTGDGRQGENDGTKQ